MFRIGLAAVLALGVSGCNVVHKTQFDYVMQAEDAAKRAAPGIRRQNAPLGSQIHRIGQKLNTARRARGLAPVSYNPRLSQIATGHASWLARPGTPLTHTNDRNQNAMMRIRQDGYPACLAAENLARGDSSADVVMRDWLASSGHRDNILLPDLQEYGFAMQGTPGNWVLLLAAPGC